MISHLRSAALTSVCASALLTVATSAAYAADVDDPNISAGITASGQGVVSGQQILFDDPTENGGNNELDNATNDEGVEMNVNNTTLIIDGASTTLSNADDTNDPATVLISAGASAEGVTVDVSSSTAKIFASDDGDAIDVTAAGKLNLDNAGVISATDGTAVNASTGTGDTIGTFVNSGTISSGSAGAAINISSDTDATTIVNTDGTISGTITLGGTVADTIQISGTDYGSTIQGTLNGNSTVGANLDINASFEYGDGTNSFTLNDITSIDVASGDTFSLGTSIIDSDGSNDLTITGAGAVSISGITGQAISVQGAALIIDSSATLVVDNASTIDGDINVSGTINGQSSGLELTSNGSADTITIQSGSATISGTISGGDDETNDILDIAVGSGNTFSHSTGAITDFSLLSVTSGNFNLDSAAIAGSITVASGATLTVSGIGSSTVFEALGGAVQISGSLVTDANASISGTAFVQGDVTGAFLGGAGAAASNTVTVLNGASFSSTIDGGTSIATDALDINVGDGNTFSHTGGAISNFDTLDLSSGTATIQVSTTAGQIIVDGSGESDTDAQLNFSGASSAFTVTASDEGVAVRQGVLKTDTNAIFVADVALDSDDSSVSGTLVLGAGGHDITVSGDGTVNALDAVTGGSGGDNIIFALDDSADTQTTGGTINLGAGTDSIDLREGHLIVQNNITAETIEIGQTDNSELEIDSGTVTANITGEANANTKTLDLDGGRINGNIDLVQGVNTIEIGGGAVVSGTILGGTNAAALTVTDGTFTTLGTIGEVETINVTGGNMTIGSGFAVTGVNTLLDVNDDRTLIVNEDVTGTGNLTFDGAITIADATALTMDALSAAAGADSTLTVVLNESTNGSLVLSSGGADLTTTDIVLSIADGAFITTGTEFTIVDGAGASTVGTIVEDSFIYSFTIATTDGGEDISVTVTRDKTFNGVAANTQNKAIGSTLETLGANAAGDLGTVVTNLGNFTTAAAIDDAIETLKPGIDGLAQGSINAQTSFMNTVNNRLATLRTNGESGVVTGDGLHSRNFWVEAYGSFIDQDERDGVAGFNSSAYGIALGADTDEILDDAVLGMSVSFGGANVDSDSVGNAQTDINTYQVTGYYSTDVYMPGSGIDGTYFDAMVAVGFNEYDTERTINVGGFDRTAKGDFDGMQYSARAALGREYDMGNGFSLIPEVSAQYSYVSLDSYTETGAGGAGLIVNPDDNNALELGVGATAAWDHQTSHGILRPELRGTVVYDVLGDEFSATSTFIGGGTSFETEEAEVAQLGARLGAGVTFVNMDGMEFGANYDADIREDLIGHTAKLNVNWKF